MADYSGRKISYGINMESVRGVAANPSAGGRWIRWETADFTDTALTVLNQSALNVLDKYSGAEITEAWSTGQLAGKITDQSIGYILYATFGNWGVTTLESGVFQHTFNESQLNACASLTVTRNDPNNTYQYTKSMVNSFEVDFKAGDFIRHTTQFVGNPNVTPMPSTQLPGFTPDENEFTSKHAEVQFNGGTAIPLASFKLTISKDVNPYWIIGQTNPGDIFAQAVEIKGEMVLRFTDQTYYTPRFANTVETVLVTVSNTDKTIGATHHPGFTFNMPTCYLTSWKPDQAIDGMVQQTIEFEAVMSLANGYAISSTLINTMNDYPDVGNVS
jgi:hypothetical protein